jgi:hypothetical protein
MSAVKDRHETAAVGGVDIGKLTDASAAFVRAAAKLPAPAPADVNVSVAFDLGWRVDAAQAWARYGSSGHLPPTPGITSDVDTWNVLIGQIMSDCQRLHEHFQGVPVDLDLSAQVVATKALLSSLDPAIVDDRLVNEIRWKRQLLRRLHEDLRIRLPVAGVSLGRAYVLGASLQAMSAGPTVADREITVNGSLDLFAGGVHAALLDLASRLPSNAAHAVDNSLRLWYGATLIQSGHQLEQRARELLEQGWRWRTLLAGEVAATDLLRMSDYVGAAGGLAERFRDTIWRGLRIYWFVVLSVVLLIAAGVALLFVSNATGSVEAGTVSLLAAFGLTWKGIGEFFGHVAAEGETRLMNAEIDWALAYRCTALSTPPGKNEISALKGKLGEDKQTKRHLRHFADWKHRWPDTEEWLPPPNECADIGAIRAHAPVGNADTRRNGGGLPA